jgi:hypothetical protein
MFRLTRKSSSGSYSQYLAKTTHSVQGGYMVVVLTLSVLWLHNMTCEACVYSALCDTITQCTAHTVHSTHRAH